MKRTVWVVSLFLMVLPVTAAPTFAQRMVTLKGNTPDAASLGANLAAASPVPPSRSLQLQVVLKVRNKVLFDRLPEEQNDPTSAYYQHQFSNEEMARDFGPSASDYQTVDNWLTSRGFQIVSTDNSFLARSITFLGTAEQIQRAFQVQLVQSQDGKFYSNMADPQHPDNIADLVGYIGGLSNLGAYGSGPKVSRPNATPHSSGSAPATVVNGSAGFAPADFYSFYSESPLISAEIVSALHKPRFSYCARSRLVARRAEIILKF